MDRTEEPSRPDIRAVLGVSCQGLADVREVGCGRPWPCDAEVVETIQVLIQTYDVRDRRSHFRPIAQDPNTFRDARRLYRLLDALCVPFAFFGSANALARWLAYPSSTPNAPWCGLGGCPVALRDP